MAEAGGQEPEIQGAGAEGKVRAASDQAVELRSFRAGGDDAKSGQIE